MGVGMTFWEWEWTECRSTESQFHFVTYRADNIVKSASDTSRQTCSQSCSRSTPNQPTGQLKFDPTQPNPWMNPTMS